MTKDLRRSRSVSLNDEEARKLLELGGSKWLRDVIEEEHGQREARMKYAREHPMPSLPKDGILRFRRVNPFATVAGDQNAFIRPVVVNLEAGTVRGSTDEEEAAYVPPIIIKIRPTAVAEFSMRRMKVRALMEHLKMMELPGVACFDYEDAKGGRHRVAAVDAVRIAKAELARRTKLKPQPPAKKARKTKP